MFKCLESRINTFFLKNSSKSLFKSIFKDDTFNTIVHTFREYENKTCSILPSQTWEDEEEIERAKKVGAQFWIIKSDDIEPRLEDFMEDYDAYKTKKAPFKVYR